MNIKENINELRNDLELLKSSVQKINDSGMRAKTILLLLSHHSGLPQKTIKSVLYSIEELNEEYFGNANEQ